MDITNCGSVEELSRERLEDALKMMVRIYGNPPELKALLEGYLPRANVAPEQGIFCSQPRYPRTPEQKHALLHRDVLKFFRQRIFHGKISQVRPPDSSTEEWLWRVDYDDGDYEDCDEYELDEILCPKTPRGNIGSGVKRARDKTMERDDDGRSSSGDTSADDETYHDEDGIRAYRDHRDFDNEAQGPQYLIKSGPLIIWRAAKDIPEDVRRNFLLQSQSTLLPSVQSPVMALLHIPLFTHRPGKEKIP